MHSSVHFGKCEGLKMRKLTINTESTEIFGNLDALDEDPAFFRNCFYATKAFEKLKRKKRLMIVVGEKGTGKSAIFRMAAMEDDESEDTFAVEAKYLKIDDKADISQKIQGWKEYLSQRIVEKISKKEQARGNLGRKVTEGIGLLASAIGDAVKTKYGIDYAQLKTGILALRAEDYKIRLYIDDLDLGYKATHEKNETIIALFTAVREMLREMENLSCRIALRTDVFDNVRREDESSDKIKDAKMNLIVTNHDIMAMLTKRVICYLDPEHMKRDYSSLHQSQMMQEMATVFETVFHGKGRWSEKPMYNVLMSFVRRRPRDIIFLCGLAWDHAVTERKQTKISTEDIEAVLDEYSKGCRSDIIAEYGQEFINSDCVNHLCGALKPSRNEQKNRKLFVYTRDALIKKIGTITEHEKIKFSDETIASDLKLAAFLYRANVIVARKDAREGNIVRTYYMEKPDLLDGGIDQGYQFEVHPAYRPAISSEINVMSTVESETEDV